MYSEETIISCLAMLDRFLSNLVFSLPRHSFFVQTLDELTISRNSFLWSGSLMEYELIDQQLAESLAKVQKYLSAPVEEDVLVEDVSKAHHEKLE